MDNKIDLCLSIKNLPPTVQLQVAISLLMVNRHISKDGAWLSVGAGLGVWMHHAGLKDDVSKELAVSLRNNLTELIAMEVVENVKSDK